MGLVVFLIYILNALFIGNTSTKDIAMKYSISFAIGGLLGDVFFHTLPYLNQKEKAQVHDDHKHDHGHDHGHDHHHEHDHHHHEENDELQL